MRTLPPSPRRRPTHAPPRVFGPPQVARWAGRALLAALGVSGCGGAQPAPGGSLAQDPESALAEAERELAAALALAPGGAEPASAFASPPAGADAPVPVDGAAPTPAPHPVAPAQSAAPEPSAEAAQDAEGAAKPAKSVERDPCSTACDAGAAIARAVERICELDGPAGARCERARSKLDDARARLALRCPSCTP